MAKALLAELDIVKNLLDYNKDSGELSWKCGKKAGFISEHGYSRVVINNQTYMAHRIAWLMHTGENPKGSIDHINGIKSDNRIENLRDVSNSVNQQNKRSSHGKTKTGVLGVTFYENRKKPYMAMINVKGKNKYLGFFETKEQASSAYWEAKKKYHDVVVP